MTISAKTKTIILWLIFTATSITLSASTFDNTFIKLNPDFKLKRLSNGRVEMTAVQNGETVKLQFEDLYADLLTAAYRKQRMGLIVNTISRKYYYSYDECRREIKHALNVLSDWNIVLREDKLASIK
jgi:hypothetical protein